MMYGYGAEVKTRMLPAGHTEVRDDRLTWLPFFIKYVVLEGRGTDYNCFNFMDQ